VIQRLRHRGLRRLYLEDDARGVPPEFAERLRRILLVLDVATTRKDADLPGLRLHALRGDWAGFFAVDVSRNWRVVFRIKEGHVWDVDLVDYHKR
jgi:proteic killer suppression protein